MRRKPTEHERHLVARGNRELGRRRLSRALATESACTARARRDRRPRANDRRRAAPTARSIRSRNERRARPPSRPGPRDRRRAARATDARGRARGSRRPEPCPTRSRTRSRAPSSPAGTAGSSSTTVGSVRRDREPTVLRSTEQRRETGRRIETRRAPPVDGTGSGHQRGSTAITQECVVLERGHCPEPTARAGRFIVNDDADRRERARGCRRRRQRRQSCAGRPGEWSGVGPSPRRDSATRHTRGDRVERRRPRPPIPGGRCDRLHDPRGRRERRGAHRDEHRPGVDRRARGNGDLRARRIVRAWC